MDDTDARSLIDAEFIVSQLVGADDALRARLVEDLAGAFAASQRAYNQSDVNQSKVTRVLQSGAAVTTDTAGLTKDLNNKSLFKTLDFRGQTVQIDASNHEIARITGGGGADCLFSVLVSSCFSSLSGWVEGQTYTSLSGCTFKTTATPQLAADYIRDNFSNSGVIAICKGSYDGGMHIHHSTQVAVVGAGREQTIIKGANPQAEVVNGYVVDAGTNGQTAAIVKFSDLTFDGTIGTGTPSVAVFGNQNASTVTLNNIQLNVPASGNGAQFNGKETISGLRIIGPSSGTQATTGFTSANNTATDGHNAQQIYISGCDRGMKFTGASLWNINGLYVTGANAARGDSNAAGAIAVHTGPGLTNSVIENVQIDNCIVGIGFTNNGGSGCQFRSFVINNTDFGIDVRGTTSGMTNNVFDGFSMVLGTAGDIGVTFSTSDSTPGAAYTQFINFNFKGYASGNEFASTANIGTGTWGAHNTSDATVPLPDFGSPYGHAAAAVGAPSPHNLVSVHHDGEQDYTNELDLLGLKVATGDFRIYSDLGITLVGEWDGATGHIGAGGSLADANSVLKFAEVFTDPAAAKLGVNAVITNAMTAGNNKAMTGLFGQVSATGAFTATGVHAAIKAQANAGASTPTISDLRGLWVASTLTASATVTAEELLYVANPSIGGGATIGTLYGLYLESLTRGSTNWAIYSLGGNSSHLGSFQFGGNATPASIVDVRGAITLDGIAAPATPAADDLVVYNETATKLLKVKDDAGAVRNLSHDHLLPAQLDVTVASTSVPYQVVGPMPQAGVITGVEAKTGENKTNGATSAIFDVHKIAAASTDSDGTGTTVFTTQGNRPTISNTHMLSTTTLPDIVAFAAGDYFAIYTDQAGTSLTVANIGIKVRYT